jgi:hypothetical protein
MTPPPFAELPLPLVTQPATNALAQTIWSWNPDANVYAVAGNMACGRGYWVYVFPHAGADVKLGPQEAKRRERHPTHNAEFTPRTEERATHNVQRSIEIRLPVSLQTWALRLSVQGKCGCM